MNAKDPMNGGDWCANPDCGKWFKPYTPNRVGTGRCCSRYCAGKLRERRGEPSKQEQAAAILRAMRMEWDTMIVAMARPREFPTVHDHAEVRCGKCREPLRGAPFTYASPEGGKYGKTCVRCYAVTWYDLAPPTGSFDPSVLP